MGTGRGWRPAAGTAITAGAAIAVLMAVGSVLTPAGQRPRLPPDQGFRDLAAAPSVPAPPRESGALRRERVTVSVVGDRLAATVIAPDSPAPPAGRPAMVFVHGGGPATRSGLIRQAERIARAGVVALVYDKRRAGYTFLRRDYTQLADDAIRMVRVLRARSDVNPDRVGVWGISEGGWVAPLAASRSPDVAFVILVAAPTMSPGAQLAWAVDDGLRRQGAPRGARHLVSRALAVGGPDYTDHDPIPALLGTRQPVLALYPAADRAVPPAESARILADTLDRAGNRSHTIRFFADADHSMRVNGRLAPGYLATMAWWIHGLPDSAQPVSGTQVTGAAPTQTHIASWRPDIPWHSSGPVLAAVFALITAGYLAGPAAAAIASWRRRGTARPPASPIWRSLRRRLRRMSVCGAVTAVGVNLAIGALAALAFTGAPGLASQGVWLALRLAAVATAVFAAAAGVAVMAAARGGWRPDGVALISLTGQLTAAGLVLLLAAHWGLYAPQW